MSSQSQGYLKLRLESPEGKTDPNQKKEFQISAIKLEEKTVKQIALRIQECMIVKS